MTPERSFLDSARRAAFIREGNCKIWKMEQSTTSITNELEREIANIQKQNIKSTVSDFEHDDEHETEIKTEIETETET